MVQSMTGFGKAEAIIKSKKIVVELRALNSKTLDLNLKYPEFLGDLDLLIRKNVSNKLIKGKIDLIINIEKNKSLNNVNHFLKKLLANNFNRSDLVIGIGGGITGDVSGFVASIYKRGINFFIPSGSGQALATLPVMLPLGEVIGLTRQTTILAFQIGDGISNLINPTLGGLIAMLSMCRVPLDKWFRFIFPYTIIVFLFSVIALIIAVYIGYQ